MVISPGLARTAEPAQMEAAYDVALAVVPRLRQRVVEAPLHLGPPEWVFDSHFDRESRSVRDGDGSVLV